MTPKKRYEIFKRFSIQNPTPRSDLHYETPFELLIATILSAQSTDKGVNKATAVLFKVANTPEAIAALGESGLKNYIKTIGLYNTKASNIIKTCHILIEKHHSKVPSTRESLESLPGVGRKTANVILNVAYQKPTMAVDTHIFRIANRIGITHGKNVREVEENLLKVVPKKFMQLAHHWLVLHGRYVCTARKPHCSTCVIWDLCEYSLKGDRPQ